MQLKFKKIGLLTTVFVYCASFLLQSNLLFFQTWAQEVNTPRVNIVAILVDDKIYDGISDGLEWYATEYVQKKLADSKALVIPIDLTKVHAYDIYRMMENIYFDGLKDVNSQLIGLIMFGDIPLPVVNQDGYIFPTVYPYVDFEDQKYVWNDSIQYFVPNGNPKGQAEIWHGLINYGTDVDAYMGLFSKIDAYLSDPDEFIGDSMWYEDFIAQKEGFLNENYKYYRNSIMFGEDIGYQRHSTLMKTMFGGESANDSAEIVEELSEKMGVDLGSEEAIDLVLEGGKTMHTTKMNQQEIETSYLAGYNELFSKNILSTIRENIFAGGRWIKLYYAANGKASNIVDVDNSSSMIQLKDTMYLGNKDLQGVIENLNLLMEDMVDKKISENRYDMDIVIPVSYMKTTGKRASFKCHKLVSRFDNYYFGNNARYVDKAQELSIYRGTYRNLSDLDGVTFDSLLEGKNPIISEYDPVDVTLKSIGGSYGIFSNQVAGNRGLMMTSVDRDLDTYDEEKTDADASLDFRDLFSIIKRLTWWKDCDEEDCENLFDFAQRWRGGASPINLDEESVSTGRYRIKNLRTHESWRPIFDMGGFQSLVPGDDEGMDGIGWHDGEGPGPQWAATSYKAYEKYSSPTQREGWERKGGWYLIYENHNPDVHKPFMEMDYWHLSPGIINGWDFSKESKSIFNVTKKSSLLSCSWLKESTLSEQYTYKVVSSLSKHVSTTEDEINGIDRDRYGESGTLGQYYRDLKKSYQDVRDDTLEILDRLSNLIKNIKTVNDLINTKIEALDTEASNLSEVADEIVNLNSEIESLKEDLESAEDEDKQGIEVEIKEKEKSLNEAEEKRKAIEGTISEFLKQISEYIDRENLLLTDIYKLIMSIFVDNIFSVMEYISYTEGGNPENFYLGLPNREKVGFLSEWISTIEGIESGIKQDGKDIIVYYNQAYDMVEDQQRAWEVLAEKLKEESDSSAEEIDKVTEKMNNVVVIDESKTDYGGENTEDEQEGVGGGPSQFKLERDSAVEAIEGPDGLFDRFDCSQGVNAMFYRLIGADTVGPAIIEAAKNDSDFKVWLVKNEINFNKFSQTDWINQYAQWAKGPGYDSAGAKKNHDLLAGVSEHMAGMNILTPDRPIDSPRYISMQSVAGKDMKFIYPDLFKVEVYELKGQNSAGFDVHKLLKPEGIKNNLIKYLKGKVDEYNQILDEHCGSALGDSAYFGRLRELGYDMATPDVGLHHCGDKFEYDEFVEALGGEEMLKVISDILYYQSLTNKKKKSSPLVEEDIDFIKKSFSLNDKRKLTLEDYLTQGMEKIKNPLLVIPMYELYGYEVAYVNSNGRDYIFSDDDLSFDKLSGIDETTFKADGLENVQPTKQQNEYNDECNIPPSGRLPLFKLSGTSVSSPWFEGFKCWLKKTKDEPFKIKLKFDSSLGEIFSTDSVEDYVKDSELGQNLSDWGDSFSKYTDSWESIIKTKSEFDPDVAITRMQVEAEQHNQSLLGGDTGISNLMGDITRGIKVENSNDLLSDSTPSSELRIESSFDVGNVSVQFYGTGEDGCLKVGEDTICKGSSITKSFNPKTNPFTGLVMSADHVAGKYALDLKISAGGQYIEKVLKYTVSPSSLDNAEIIVEDNKSIAGLLTPVKVIGYDKYGNVISWGFEKYNFTTTQGRFLKDGAYQDSFSTNDFRDLNFYYQAPLDAVDGSEAVIQISSERNPGVYLATHHQILAQAAPEIKLNGSTILKGKDNLEVNQSYQLTDDESVYDGDSLNVSRLQKLDIEMRDLGGKLVDIDSQIMVTSKNGMVIIGQLQKDENGKDKFFETPKNYMSGGYATVYYYASTKAGDDVISIDIPGLDTRKINLKVYPSQTSNVQINILNGYVELEKYTDFEVFTLDKWGNSTDTTVEIHYDPSYVEIQEVPGYVKEIYRDDSLVIDSCKVENGYLKTSIFGAGPGITEVEVKGYTSVIFKVDSRLFPEEKLNIMYLNYFGNDWGNQWGYFSDNNKYIEMLMNNSEKIITTTTQLISEEKIKKMLWKIQPGFKISSDAAVDTVMVMDGKNINVLIGGMTSMQVPLPSLAWMSVGQESMENILSNSVGASQNYAFFVAADSKYSVDKNGVLYDGGKRIGSILGGEIALQLSDASLDNGDNIWDITYKGAECGSLVLHYPKFKPSDSDFENPGKGYVVSKTFNNGTTDNLSSVGIFDMSTEFELDTSYKSIQNSDEIEERVGFLGDFKNITLFAEGEIVGEATKKYGSEFVINLGDPLLSRKDKNEFVHGTMFDGGIGNEIYVDSENNIFGNYQIDFNNDKLKDLLVVYVDGTVKLAKNYGGTPDMRNMQELMRLAVGIKEVFVGDVDGNKYDDIIVFTENNQLRVYMNDKGQFDVDGKVACLNQNVFGGEISSTPTSLEGISQIFVEDMDLDGIMDVLVYDEKGYVKVFYGGTTNGGPNYLSMDAYSCDSGWYNRQVRNTTVITALGVQVSGDPIFDNSMLYREGMDIPVVEIEKSKLKKYGIYFDPDSFTDDNIKSKVKEREWNSDGDMSDATLDIMENFDVKKASQKYTDISDKFVNITLYENTLLSGEGNNYVFAPSSFLNPDDPDDIGSVWKNYSLKSGSTILQDGDIVTVRVTVKASDEYSFRGAFADVIQGPWNLYFDQDEIFEGIRFVTGTGNAVIKKKDGNFAYIIDNIELSPGEKMIFEYDLEFHRLPLRTLSLSYQTYWSDDIYPDVKMQSVDGCEKNFDVYVNGGGSRSFSYDVINLKDMVDEEYLDEESETEDYTEDILSIGSDVNQIPGIVGDSISRISLLNGDSAISISNDESGKKSLENVILQKIQEGGLESLNINLNIDLNLFEDQMNDIENVVDDITKGMCNGFSFGGSNNCKGLPVPFNQAFLAPGKYHLFGCWELPLTPLDKGLPIFFFPGTFYTPVGVPVPMPWGLKNDEMDDFIWVPGGTYGSFIRIYAAPTLTAQLGVAICISPDRIWRKVPSPLSDIAGNCIVFAVKPQCKGDDSGFGSENKDDLDNPEETYPDFIEDVRDSGVCLQSQKGPMVTLAGMRSSPFNMFSYSSQVKQLPKQKGFSLDDTLGTITWNNKDVNGGLNNDVEYSTSFMGIIELETSSYIGADETDETKNSIYIGDVDILGGEFSVNKIRGGIQQGVRKLLIDKWLDPQIRYILNQLTKMHVNIKVPNVTHLIDNEAQTLKNVSSNIGDIWSGTKSSINESNLTDPITNWSDITYDSFKDFNKSIANPFESLATMLNESNIINISTETLVVKIPMIFKEDIDAYQLYLQQRLDTNSAIIEEWEMMFNTFATSCAKEPTQEAQQKCEKQRQEAMSSFIEFKNTNWVRFQNQIYANLIILQKYRDFPFEIYERIHVIDRYMSEIASLINNTLGYLSYWTNANSQRFVGYVDAIVLIINIIKTYQLLINFSIEWGQNCGNCARDTYDQYSCKLSMLCDMIQLPIIQIPNFKLPNITIDLTNIDLGLDIVLPEFNFQPIRVDLPELPNLPEPMMVNIQLFDLPNIPVLPEPPELPELPSFIPEVELELPILPPAPEVPKLPNSIEGVIKIADLIGKIYCIVKGQFGLVGESSVKAKIEQLTQRTYPVDWIDNIMDFTNWSVAPVHNYGVDYEIDSYVDLQFNFKDFYDYLDTLTKSINNLTTSTVNSVNSKVDSLINENPITDIRDSLDGMSVDVKLGKADINIDENGLMSDDIEYVDYESGKSRLKDVLAYFKGEVNNTSFSDSIGGSINKIENQIDKHSDITANESGIENVRTAVMDYLDKERVNYDALADMINSDYDGFLAMVDAQSNDESVKGKDENKMLTFNVQLFNVDPSTRDSIKNIAKDNPYKTILDNKQSIVDGYWDAINNNSADDLGLSKSQYLVLRNDISTMRKNMNVLQDLVKPVSSTNLIAKNGAGQTNKSLVAGLRIGSQMEVATVVDASLFSKGIYEKNADGKFTKVIYSESFTDDMKDSYYHTSHSSKHDIILWDENSIYKKCFGQACLSYGGSYGKYYHSSTVKEIPNKETWLEFDGDTILKIADKYEEVKDRKVANQNFDMLTFSWTLEDVDAYLLKLVERIDNSYEKEDYNNKVPVIYVLALPDYVDENDLYANGVKLELLNQKIDEIQNLYGKDLVQIVHYDSHKKFADIGINNIDRKWYYMRVASLSLNKDTYNINSPWSNQIVAGRQIAGDGQGPTAEAKLYRPSVSKVVSEGDTLEGYVGTRYKLIVDWEDNVAMSSMNLSREGKVLTGKSLSSATGSISIDIDIHTKAGTETFVSKGVDQFGNEVEKTITMTFLVPDIDITDIAQNPDGESVSITAEISQDIDQGNVTFQRKRGTSRKSMVDDYPLGPGDTIVVGGPYSMGGGIAMYGKNGDSIASVDPDTAEIKINSGYKEDYEIRAIVEDGALLKIYDKKNNKSVFSLSIPAKECVKFEAKNFNVVDLPEKGKMGEFNGGKAVYNNGTNVLFASPTCYLYSEFGLEGTYDFDRELQAVVLTLYLPSDLTKKNPIKVWFKAKPFENK